MKFGILGLGSIGMRHALNLIGLGHDVKGYDPDIGRRAKFKKIGGRCVNTVQEAIEESEAVVVASPTAMHDEHLSLAIEQGKHVLVEKPISDKPLFLPHYDKDELVFAVGNNMRFHPCVQYAKEWLLSNPGKVFWAEFTVAQRNRKYTDDVISNWGAHELDLAQYLLGRARVAGASGSPVTMNAVLSHGVRNCCSSVLTCYQTVPEIRGFSIAAESGVLHADLVSHGLCLSSEWESDYFINYENDIINRTYIDEIREFIAAIDGHDVPILARAQDGLATLDLILKIQEMASY